jgi:deoxyribodipyrimidine photolyase-related protein
MKNLVFILGDQLSHKISSLEGFNKSEDKILMCEVMSEATYTPHHKKKLAYIFSAMRHFAEELNSNGHSIFYTKIDEPKNQGSFFAELENFCKINKPKKIIITEASEWRVLDDIKLWQSKLGIEVEIRTDNRFICSIDEFKNWAAPKKGKKLLMEDFYRNMRKKTGYLMLSNGKPVGEKWNFDHDNRKAAPKNQKFLPPKQFTPDKITAEVIQIIQQKFSDNFGSLEDFFYATNRSQALEALAYFIKNFLPNFGDFQDAMLQNEAFLYHSVLAQYMNSGLLLPSEICEAAIAEYKNNKAPINAVEGFIRQIIGWREFIRGIYWLHMPEYKNLNYLNAKRPLPDFYWGKNYSEKAKDCKLNCINQVVRLTEKHAYSHHIQRLMVTGNFALLAGLDVAQVCDWYLAVYLDAYEWVELPNTLGMALHADAGIVGTKPYIASGAYINRMSNFCKNCEYDVNQKTGEKACPFNYLYWNFLIEHQDKFGKNPRMGIAYNNLKRLNDEDKKLITQSAQSFFNKIS